MKIPINKDFEKDYKDDIFHGYTFWETFFLALGMAVGVGTVLICYFFLAIPIEAAVYAAVPGVIAVGYLGFSNRNGKSILEWKRIKSREITRLTYYAGENLFEDEKWVQSQEIWKDLMGRKKKKRKKKSKAGGDKA